MKRAAAFLVALALVAGIAWLGGYDFNQRSPLVAAWAGWAVVAAAWVAAWPGFDK